VLRAGEEHHDIDDEEDDDGDLECEHPAVGLVVLQHFVEFADGAELVIDGAVPVAGVEPGGGHLVEAGDVPVAEELGDVGQLVAEAGHVDAQFAEVAEELAAAADGDGEIPVGPFEGGVEEAVVGFEFGELEVREFEDVEGFLPFGGFVDQQGGVPVDDDEVVLVIAEMAGGGFEGFLAGEAGGVRFLGEEGGDGAAVGFEPGFAPQMGLGTSRGGGERTVEAEDRVGLLVGDPLDGAEDVWGEFRAGLFGELPGLFLKRS